MKTFKNKDLFRNRFTVLKEFWYSVFNFGVQGTLPNMSIRLKV